MDSSENGYQSITICPVEFQHAGTYVAKVKTQAGECVSSPCVVTVVQGPALGLESEQANWRLHFAWIRANNLLCIYCHKLCSSPASACQFCFKFYNCKGSFKADKPWPCPVLVCADCRAEQSHCRMCKELLRWPDKSEEEACSCAGACSHQCGQEEGEGMESINIDEYLSILNNSEEELKNLKSPLIWEHKINPMLGLKQVMRTNYFSHCLTLEQKSDTPFGGVLDKIHPFSNPYLNLLQLFNLQGVSSFLPPPNFPM